MSGLGAILAGLVVVGGGLGSGLRVIVLSRVAARDSRWGTAWVNVPASFLAGVAATLLSLGVGPGPAVVAESPAHGSSDLAATVGLTFVLGVCGGLSTYSSLALEAALALRRRDRRLLAVQASGVGLGLLTAAVGVVTGVAVLVLLRPV